MRSPSLYCFFFINVASHVCHNATVVVFSCFTCFPVFPSSVHSFPCAGIVFLPNHLPGHLEHKNMPLDDALGLIDRDYERYCKNIRDGRIPPRRGPANREDMSQLLSRAASGESLSQDQLTVVIGALQKKQDQKSPVPQSASSSGRPSEQGEREQPKKCKSFGCKSI